MRVIGILNHKGGVGKTFLAFHLAAGLGDMMGYKVLAIDYDAQGDLMKWGSGGKWNGEERYDTKNVTYYYSPDRIDIETEQTDLFDFVLIDGRPDYNAMSDFIEKCDALFVPVQGRLSLDGATDVFRIRQFMEKKNVPVWIIRNMMAQVAQLISGENKLITLLEKTYDVRVGVSCFSYSESVRMAERYLTPIWYLPGNTGNVIKTGLTKMLNWLSDQFGDARKLNATAFKEVYNTYREVTNVEENLNASG